MPNLERADQFNRASAVTIPTMKEIRSAKSAGVSCTSEWIASQRRTAKKKAATIAAGVAARKTNAAKASAIDKLLISIPVKSKTKAELELEALKAEFKNHQAKKY